MIDELELLKKKLPKGFTKRLAGEFGVTPTTVTIQKVRYYRQGSRNGQRNNGYTKAIKGNRQRNGIMKTLYTQQEAAAMLRFKHYRSLDRLIASGRLECIKRPGRTGRKLFTEEHIQNYIMLNDANRMSI
jgi:hypothetical protein